MVKAADPGIDLYVRNKHPQGVQKYSAEKILLFVHGATYPAETSFDLKLNGLSWMDPYKRYVEIGEGTHTVIMEKNRMLLFQAVQQFLDENLRANQ